jgi:hypothetical protein
MPPVLISVREGNELPMAIFLAALISFLYASQMLTTLLPFGLREPVGIVISLTAFYFLINIVFLAHRWFTAPAVDVSYDNIVPRTDADEYDDEPMDAVPRRKYHSRIARPTYRPIVPVIEPAQHPVHDDDDGTE